MGKHEILSCTYEVHSRYVIKVCMNIFIQYLVDLYIARKYTF